MVDVPEGVLSPVNWPSRNHTGDDEMEEMGIKILKEEEYSKQYMCFCHRTPNALPDAACKEKR